MKAGEESGRKNGGKAHKANKKENENNHHYFWNDNTPICNRSLCCYYVLGSFG